MSDNVSYMEIMEIEQKLIETAKHLLLGNTDMATVKDAVNSFGDYMLDELKVSKEAFKEVVLTELQKWLDNGSKPLDCDNLTCTIFVSLLAFAAIKYDAAYAPAQATLINSQAEKINTVIHNNLIKVRTQAGYQSYDAEAYYNSPDWYNSEACKDLIKKMKGEFVQGVELDVPVSKGKFLFVEQTDYHILANVPVTMDDVLSLDEVTKEITYLSENEYIMTLYADRFLKRFNITDRVLSRLLLLKPDGFDGGEFADYDSDVKIAAVELAKKKGKPAPVAKKKPEASSNSYSYEPSTTPEYKYTYDEKNAGYINKNTDMGPVKRKSKGQMVTGIILMAISVMALYIYLNFAFQDIMFENLREGLANLEINFVFVGACLVTTVVGLILLLSGCKSKVRK